MEQPSIAELRRVPLERGGAAVRGSRPAARGAPYRDAFAKRVPAAERELAAVLREDKREDRRAAAAFLLAHLPSGSASSS